MLNQTLLKQNFFKFVKKSKRPETRVKNKEPEKTDPDWIIWAAWADRITFEEIFKKTGKREQDVIKIMRKSLSPKSFKLWRERVHTKSIKNRRKFEESRRKLKISKSDFFVD